MGDKTEGRGLGVITRETGTSLKSKIAITIRDVDSGVFIDIHFEPEEFAMASTGQMSPCSYRVVTTK